ncbi:MULTISPECIES: monovalent cation/H(+) antiporter subunit G [Streptomyces]|uniref:Multicomponent Na+:H+ antiporter subunit G n=1 Tax=Streptomyces harbinensis TaxID=1176198 RepID=A0A1I6R095_9ACTN|nr:MULTISPECIES: monovalent cation/H(+) antiporter subunit G [Streptomyces]QKV67586.1 monovalent cation/H(+) antiporter subunit G [Streptomyces harbinensis]SFS58157.1 multicomponent Na+:H+ antiporter subunit G [Streptomyces harbinensis]
MSGVREVVGVVLMLGGALFSLLAGVGMLRFADTVSRLHAASKAQTLGLLLVLVGAAVHEGGPSAPPLLLIGVFMLVTAPVMGHVVARIAYRTDAVARERLTVDQLGDRLSRQDAAEPPPR